MKDLAIILLNSKTNLEFENCDVYKDSSYSNELDIFEKLNHIGILVRDIEIENDKEYKLVFIINENKYKLSEFSKNWFNEFYINNLLDEHEIYSDDVNLGLNMKESGLSYSLIISRSISFNFISNFSRFKKEFERLTNITNPTVALYTFCVHQKLKMSNYNLEYGKKKLL
jgi:hypothetical protein